MAATTHPTQGDGVRILSSQTRFHGQVTTSTNGSLTVELAESAVPRPKSFSPGSELELEWVDSDGPMHVTARVEEAGAGPNPTLELALLGEPEPVERREHDRGQVDLDVSAWTLAQATRRLTGTTIDLSPSGALLLLPDLAPHAATLELQIALPDGTVYASATIRRRVEGGRVGVEFVHIDPEQRTRLVEFLRSR